MPINQTPVYLAQSWFSYECSTFQSGVEVATLKGLECVFRNILRVAVRFAGIALLIMLIVGGFKWMTAGGDAKKAQSAQLTLTYAIIGLVTIICVWFIFLLIKTITGVDVLNFVININ